MTEPETSQPIEPTEALNLHPKRIDPETAPRSRIKELEVMVAEVIRETPDTATKHCLALDMKIRHTMIYGNKTWEGIIYRRQL
jgi:hypothetical protein